VRPSGAGQRAASAAATRGAGRASFDKRAGFDTRAGFDERARPGSRAGAE
jgi:hypothetical protein